MMGPSAVILLPDIVKFVRAFPNEYRSGCHQTRLATPYTAIGWLGSALRDSTELAEVRPQLFECWSAFRENSTPSHAPFRSRFRRSLVSNAGGSKTRPEPPNQ